MKLLNIKKGSAELVSIVVAVCILGALAVGVIIFIGNSVVDNQKTNLEPTVNTALSAINS